MKTISKVARTFIGVLLALLLIPVGQAVAVGFTPTGSMNTARSAATATLLTNGKVLVTGGGNISGILANAELYDPTTYTFTQTGSMGAGRHFHTATLLPNGKVLLAGGIGNGGSLVSAELYDPVTGTFAPTGSLGAGRHSHTATLLPNGKVLLAGGRCINCGTHASSELYDPATGTFTPTGSMSLARTFHTATLLANGKVLLAGGVTIGAFLDSAELYDPTTGLFTPTGSMGAGTGGQSHTATLLPNGKVLVTGGYFGGIVAYAVLYDPTTNTFTPTGSLGTGGRAYHTATLLPNGMVLIASGYGYGWGFAGAELYDPVTGSFTSVGSLGLRANHTGTLLPNGKVLLAGGDGASGYLASAELYESAMPPIASAGSDQNIYLGQSAFLNGTASTHPTGGTLTYAWTLDSAPAGSIATLNGANTATPSLYPDVAGVYHISLVVNDGQANSAASTLLINVSQNLPPVAAATGSPIAGYAPLQVLFNSSASHDPENSLLTYSWNFGDPTSASNTSVLMNPIHAYPALGNYTAVVTVTDNMGKTDQASVAVTVTAPNLPPVVAPTATPNNGNSPLSVQFAANATDVNPGDVLSYSWNFGDGSPVSTLANPQHTYVMGTYIATVQVSDGVNAPVSASLTISASSALTIDVTEAKV
ncbi:MAG: PKD domain-containing protein, partial [Pseudomonadota bacterium]